MNDEEAFQAQDGSGDPWGGDDPWGDGSQTTDDSQGWGGGYDDDGRSWDAGDDPALQQADQSDPGPSGEQPCPAFDPSQYPYLSALGAAGTFDGWLASLGIAGDESGDEQDG